MSVNIKPLEDRIVVKPLDAEQTTASGLVIPDTAKEKPQEGEVLAIGPGRIDDNGNRVPLDVAIGDKVIYSKYGGTEVKYGGDELPDPLRARRPRGRFLTHWHPAGGVAPLDDPLRLKVAFAAAPCHRRQARQDHIEGETCPRSSSSTSAPAGRWSAASTSWPTPSR